MEKETFMVLYRMCSKLFKKNTNLKLQNLVQTKEFPTKLLWKMTVTNSIKSVATSARLYVTGH